MPLFLLFFLFPFFLISCSFRSGTNELSYSILHQDTAQATQLLNQGHSPNISDSNGVSPLMIALQKGTDLELIKHLVASGADINAIDTQGNSVLTYALTSPNTEGLDFLLTQNININGTSEISPLMFASQAISDSTIIEKLLTAGADINQSGPNGFTPLFYSLSNENPQISKLLIEKGAKLNAKTYQGWSPLMVASMIKARPIILETLIKNGSLVNEQTKNGLTPLMISLISNAPNEQLDILIKNGAHIDTLDFFGWTPLMYSSLFSNSYTPYHKINYLSSWKDLKNKEDKTASDYQKVNPFLFQDN